MELAGKLQTNQIKLQRLKQEYARFSKAVDLPMQHERMEVAGFTWKDGKAAEKAHNRLAASSKEISQIFGVNNAKDLKKAVNRGTIKLQNGFACFPDGDQLNENAKKVTPIEGFFDVACTEPLDQLNSGRLKTKCLRGHWQQLFGIARDILVKI